MIKKKKRPIDVNQRAKYIVDIATGHQEDIGSTDDDSKNPDFVRIGRLGGLKGGKARADKLSADERKSIAKKAAKTRWDNHD